MPSWPVHKKKIQRRDCFEPHARKRSVTKLFDRLDPNTQIPSISIPDEILLICKQPQVNSFWCARLSPLTVCPEGINTNMKNLDSILSRPHWRLSLNINHISALEQRATHSQGGQHPLSAPFGVQIRRVCLSVPFRWAAGGGPAWRAGMRAW